MNCIDVEPLLIPLIEGDLTDEEGKTVRDHCRHCSACAKRLDDAKHYLATVQQAFDAVEPSFDMEEAIANELAFRKLSAPHPLWGNAIAWRRAAAVLLIGVLGLTVWLYANRPTHVSLQSGHVIAESGEFSDQLKLYTRYTVPQKTSAQLSLDNGQIDVAANSRFELSEGGVTLHKGAVTGYVQDATVVQDRQISVDLGPNTQFGLVALSHNAPLVSHHRFSWWHVFDVPAAYASSSDRFEASLCFLAKGEATIALPTLEAVHLSGQQALAVINGKLLGPFNNWKTLKRHLDDRHAGTTDALSAVQDKTKLYEKMLKGHEFNRIHLRMRLEKLTKDIEILPLAESDKLSIYREKQQVSESLTRTHVLLNEHKQTLKRLQEEEEFIYASNFKSRRFATLSRTLSSHASKLHSELPSH